ncbi:hypothetical protein GTV32_14190 [Gordonia sp. SID5947]|uniref:hypothetical protein n=1 Tax=Gordonia sp. SID5947 TaxID=2690315 RepID=UPI00136B27C3|nr:hypothetical protein [Gordonia sp. SID5947]MYR07386.1 hypothetical protein [Gordonia sp. SID5947]
MAIAIRSELELPTLRILLDPQRRNFSEAVFQVVVGRATPQEVARCQLEDLGMPNTLTGRNPVEGKQLTIPEDVVTAIQEAVSGLKSPLPPHRALWLEFPSPRGFLYVMPWERLLEPLDRPLFRLPNHLVRPQVPGDTLEVALCSSAPMAKSAFVPPYHLAMLAEHYQSIPQRAVTVHVFTDERWFPEMRDTFADNPSVVVYDPDAARRYDLPERDPQVATVGGVSSPWLQWMRDVTGDKPIDFVHFVTHGYLSGDLGAIALASSPVVKTDQHWSRFIGSVELDMFMSQVGAWGLGLTSPPHNFSEAGLRALADSIALIRSGVAITHISDRDPDGAQLGAVLQAVFAPDVDLTPVPGVTCWTHPLFTEVPDTSYEAAGIDDSSSMFATDTMKTALAEADTASWVASASRVLETQQMRWLPDSADEAPDLAAVTALQNVAALVERHVNQAYPQQFEGGAS